MKITEAEIRHAGPLKKQTVTFEPVTLIVGNNERGKTTLSDVLIRELFQPSKGKSKSPADNVINPRFQDTCDVKITTDGEQLPGDLAGYASLLVIREGDIRWSWKSGKDIESKDYWNTDIKEVLYGRDGVFTKINAELGELLGVRTNASWLMQLRKNTAQYREAVVHACGEIGRAKSARERLAGLTADYAAVRAEWERQQAGLQVNDLQRKYDAGFTYFRLIDEKKKNNEELAAIEARGPEKIRKDWVDAERESVRLDGEIAIEEQKLKSLKSDSSNLTEFDRSIAEKEEYLRRKQAELDGLSRSTGNAKPAGSRTALTVIASVLTVLGLTGITLTILAMMKKLDFDPIVLLLLSIAFFLPGTAGIIYAIAAPRPAQQQNAGLHMQAGLLNETIGNTRAEIDGLIRRRAALQAALSENTPESIERRLAELRARQTATDAVKRELRLVYASIDQVEAACGRLSELRGRAGNLDSSMDQTRRAVEELFGNDNETYIQSEMKTLQKEISKKTGGTDIKYIEEQFAELDGRKNGIEAEMSALRQSIESATSGARSGAQTAYSAFLRDFGKSADRIRSFYSEIERVIPGENPYLLFGIAETLEEWERRIDADIRYSQIADKAFTGIQANVDILLNGVFRSAGFSKALAAISGGFYTGVETVIRPNSPRGGNDIEIGAITSSGEKYRFADLSTGARNMFYFAIRMGIAIDRFAQTPYIFLLDDAFLSFDHDRRRNALTLLKEYAGMGWQIIYFSVNDLSMENTFAEVFGGDFMKLVL
ncbi:MAG: hypothetical protein HPY53_07985 [Brevinematales bacterium]|nr:hypothetical protein [Brevinematales bacterium]